MLIPIRPMNNTVLERAGYWPTPCEGPSAVSMRPSCLPVSRTASSTVNGVGAVNRRDEKSAA